MTDAPPLDPVEVAYAGVVGQRELLRAGRVSATDLLELCLARIERYDGRLGAFATLRAEAARAEAAAADAARADGDDRPLLGVPIAVKDNMAVAGVAPSFGTGSAEPVAARDGEPVRRLRAAGAVVVGTTTLPELALWPFTESATWGATANPWSTGHTPGGSSGGSAAAVAAGLVPLATASDGGGSIRIPAACCGLVGLKPQRGRVPVGGPGERREHWHGLTVGGVVTRSVADTALALEVLAARPLDPDPADRLRVGWTLRGMLPGPVDPQVRAALERVLTELAGLGHRIEPVTPAYDGAMGSFLLRYTRGAREDLVRLAEPGATEARTRFVAALGGLVPPRLVQRASRDEAGRAALPGDVDLLVLPTLPVPPWRVGALRGFRAVLRAGALTTYTAPWNVAGQPALSLPAGWTATGLPLAVQLVGPAGSEARLLRVAAELEPLIGWRDRRPLLTGAP